MSTSVVKKPRSPKRRERPDSRNLLLLKTTAPSKRTLSAQVFCTPPLHHEHNAAHSRDVLVGERTSRLRRQRKSVFSPSPKRSPSLAAGVWYPRVMRGRVLRRNAMASNCA